MCVLYLECERSLVEDLFIYAKKAADSFSPIQREFGLQAADAQGHFVWNSLSVGSAC